ncbi:MAG TPA: winged helix-turn-helix domain-containing protein [Candidatus Cybelea sp.]|nr:winged helix-turn-helix domain-containing protein [Candidatus Cybelea sp.]
MSRSEKVIYEFGPFRIDPVQHLLFRNGSVISLPPKTVETLVVLVENHGRLVEKERLMEAVWPDTFVEEANLTVHISALRRLFRDEVNGEPYIETVPRRGYRFVAPVEERFGAESEPAAAPVPSLPPSVPERRISAHKLLVGALCALALLSLGWFFIRKRGEPTPGFRKIHSVAVLPLQNLSGDPGQDYLADGLTEALLTDLAQIHSLRVISRTSVMTYKGTKKKLPDIARELDVDAVVEGSLARSGDRVQVFAQLVDAHKDAHLWAQTYQASLRDLLSLENRVAQAIVQEVGAVLTPDEKLRLTTVRLVSPESHDAYMQGRYLWNKRTPETLRKSMDLFESAIRLDPSSAEAYSAMATAYVSMLGSDQFPPRETEAKARVSAEKALALDDTIAEPHAVFAILKAVQEYDWKTSDAEFERAEELDPSYVVAHHWHAFMLASRGLNEEAYAEIQKAHELDPRNPGETTAIAFVLYWARKYDACINAANQALELASEYYFALEARGECQEQLKRYDAALADYEHALRVSPRNNGGVGRLGHLYGVLGQKSKARGELADIAAGAAKSSYVPVWQEALICIGLGEQQRALDLLEQDQELRTTGSLMLRDDAIFDGLRSETRFVTLVKRAHLDE